MNDNDDELMIRAAGGEVEALSVLFERHHRPLFRFFHRTSGSTGIADDLTQEVFFRMLKFRATFQAGMRFRPWMYKIARNVHADLLRKRRAETPLPEHEEFKDGSASAELALVHSGDLAILRRAFERLPPEKRELLVLSRWQELPYDEIAGILQCEPGTVKTRVFRAMQQLGETFFRLSGRRAS